MQPTRSLWMLLCLLATAALTGWGCDGGLSISWDDDDDAGDDDAGDDDAGDDDAGDDDAGDDDAGDDDTEPDFSHIEGSYLYFLDFGDMAEGMGYTDCVAPYTLAGPNVTGSTQHLCEACDHIFQLSHNPDPFEEVDDCVSQMGYEGGSYERLYGFEWVTDAEFYLWRNFGDVDAELEDYGWGAFEDAEFWFDSDLSENVWVNTWSEGDGIFGG
jgi:hypothetical protein